MRAVRNIRLCTKDCLCLYVCPTGATNTENGQIDAARCLPACRACVDACPSGAISKVPYKYPPQQEKSGAVVEAMNRLARSKAAQEAAAARLAVSGQPGEALLGKALRRSIRVLAEDLSRESGYMLPQSQGARAFLEGLLEQEQGEGFPREAVEKLLTLLGR